MRVLPEHIKNIHVRGHKDPDIFIYKTNWKVTGDIVTGATSQKFELYCDDWWMHIYPREAMIAGVAGHI